MKDIHGNKEYVNSYFRNSYSHLDMGSIPWVTGAVGIELQRKLIEGVITEGQKVLDIGCGVGTEAIFLSRQGLEVTALDRESKALNIALKYASLLETKVDFLNEDILLLDTNKKLQAYQQPTKTIGPLFESFDLVIDQGCFHHILPIDRKNYVSSVYGVLKDKGSLFLRGFSDKMKKSLSGDGPIRLNKENLINTFSEHFQIKELYTFENIPVPQKPDVPQLFWFMHGEKK